MYYYKDRHSKQSKYAIRRRKKVNSVAITISNFSVTAMAIWLMMVASIVGQLSYYYCQEVQEAFFKEAIN